jgi:hypothetical protein
VAELEVTHRQKLQDAHLQAARSHTNTIYIPLNAALSVLASAFLDLREQPRIQSAEQSRSSVARLSRWRRGRRPASNQVAPEALAAFDAAIVAFLESTQNIVGEGNDAFLTADLDARLRDFSAFLRASRTATASNDKAIVRTVVPALESTLPLLGLPLPVLRLSAQLTAAAFGVGGVVVTDEVLAAPPSSRDFEARFQRDIAAMKNSIRDVTLGAADTAPFRR